jgi:3-oxoacyl-(acyl-carrier-protein) synthase
MAMNNNGILPGDLSAVCTHGPSDVQIDRAETRIMREVLGRHAYRIPMPSIKGVTGNPLAAGGAMQTIAAALMITEGVAHPTANLTEPDPDCDLDYVPGRARPADLDRVLINAHGMGGVNSALVVRRWSSG